MTANHQAGPQGQYPAVWVAGAYPSVLLAVLGQHGGIPQAMRESILRQLHEGHRSPAELRERIERRWWSTYSHLPAGDIAERADEIALALVAAPPCSIARCEDGWHLDADRGCPQCRQRHIDTDALPATGPAASSEHIAATAAAIRRTIRASRTSAHHRQSRLDERLQQGRSTTRG
ncbi:hypothetical protein [Streptomyces sp. NRRL B-24484]|uniref:hypothetical protein n=1 Tax=Streptomyces sp. NRRL B-24484 TaxID=1463833 RepID=UPI0004C298E0|nr:hypothetical protein [Streptomyces sp. NRRL B-24484]